jgi:hypothetical protein
LRWLYKQRQRIEGYRLLCHNCNGSREFYGSCPHTWENPRVRPHYAVRRATRNDYYGRNHTRPNSTFPAS